eukprot:COSAG06_NODE_33019_length_496_cov_2.390428_1_plen_82_part_01
MIIQFALGQKEVGEAKKEWAEKSQNMRRIAGKTRSKRPQLPWGWREHRSGRPRSKDRHRPQLCAKPPHRPPAAQRASAPSLP